MSNATASVNHRSVELPADANMLWIPGGTFRMGSEDFYREGKIQMRASNSRLHSTGFAVLACLLAYISMHPDALAQPGKTLVPALQERFALSEPQVRGALGALLVFARERLSKPAFDDLAERIPNAEHAMQEAKMSGVVTGPLDTLSDYEASLARLGIGPPIASEFAPAVVEYLGASGYDRERAILWGVLN